MSTLRSGSVARARHPTPRPNRPRITLSVLLALGALVALVGAGPARAQQGSKAPARQDPRWAAIQKVFGVEGEAGDGYFRVNFPRSDLHVRIEADTLSPDFEFTSYFGFVPVGTDRMMTMGEVILEASEVPAAVAEARRQGVNVTALHNHLRGTVPQILYMHVQAEGAADAVARELRSVLARTGTSLHPGPEEPARGDWAAIDSILGTHAEAEGRVAEYVFPRGEKHTVGGVAVKSSGVIETASEVVFQDLGGGRVASTGELYVLPGEVQGVVSALEEHGLPVSAIHNHMLEEEPRMYWIHWYVTGVGPALARGVAAALARTDSARRSASESGSR